MKNIVKILRLGYNGEGIAKDETSGKIIFVPYALQDETVEIKVQKEKSNFIMATTCEILNKSVNRINAPCPYFQICGGCDLQHTNYPSQLEFKTKLVKDTLKSVGKIQCEVLPCLPCTSQFNYRNKMVFPVNNLLGMFKQNSHDIIPIQECLLQKDFSKKIISIFNKFIAENNISSYDEVTKQGLLKYVSVRCIKNAFLFTFVINGDKLPNTENLISLLSENFENFGLYLNINKNENSEILSSDFIHLFGLKMLSDNFNGLQYKIGPYSFLQVNEEIKNLIYSSILNLISENENVVDAFSGAGLLSAIISKKAKRVYSIEINKEAHQSACDLMKSNKITNCECFCGDCKIFLPKITKNLGDYTLILDPPRSGCDKDIINTINNTKPNKIIYVSCNAPTLARDLQLMEDYKIIFVQPYDMFPQTKHVETLVYLIKK